MNATIRSLTALTLVASLLIVPVGCNQGGSAPKTLPVKAGSDDAPAKQLGQLSKASRDALLRRSSGEELTALFSEITKESDVDFTFRNGQEAGLYAILESLGGGLALIDFDGDGLLDVFITGGGYFDGSDKKQVKGHGNRLYKNLGGWKFQDVTKEVGLDQPLFFTHGCAVGDFNRDGWPDLLVTGWGRVALYRNESDGKGGRRFVEVSKEAGLAQGLFDNA